MSRRNFVVGNIYAFDLLSALCCVMDSLGEILGCGRTCNVVSARESIMAPKAPGSLEQLHVAGPEIVTLGLRFTYSLIQCQFLLF
ncbi:hypothetical protein ACFX2A_015133 [Malus domestica]